MKTKKKHHIFIVTPLGKNGKGGIDKIMDNIRNHWNHNPNNSIKIIFGTSRGSLPIIFSLPTYLFLLVKIIVFKFMNKCDLLHINLASYGSTYRKILISYIAQIFRIPYIIHLHGAEFKNFYLKSNKLSQILIKNLFRNSKNIIVLGTTWKNFLIQSLYIKSDKIIILPNASHSIFKPDKEATCSQIKQILFLGCLTPRKGIPQLIESLGKLKDRQDWTAVIAGNGPTSAIETSLSKNKITDRVQLPGWVGPHIIEKLLKESDILILPSFAENLPMSVIEAMSAGLAIITTPVGAIPDIIIHQETGILVPPGNIKKTAEAIELLLNNPEIITKLGNGARKYHLKNLEIKNYIIKISNIWQDSIK